MLPIRIVLVEPSHPGNIGATARAMKNMGFSELVLVNPKVFPHSDATARAAGADDILANARIVDNLNQALENCTVIFATSARMRALDRPVISPREFSSQLQAIKPNTQTAILFGRESSGLTNDELDKAQTHIHIPTNPEFSSLNLAQAVQLLLYEARMGLVIEKKREIKSDPDFNPASQDQLEQYFVHLEKTLEKIQFLQPHNPKQLMRRLRRLYTRAGLEHKEIQILRGILSAIEYRCITKQPNLPKAIYLDYMATTPVDPRVAIKMAECLTMDGVFGNPASNTHEYGTQALNKVNIAREQVADLINASSKEIIWTSGATEANNLAIKGVAQFYQHKGKHIITCLTEHKAVIDPCIELEKQGFEITYLKPKSNGLIDLKQLENSIRPDTILITIMHANNEIGVIQDLKAIGKITREKNIVLHSDAAQTAGKITIDVDDLGVDLMSFSAHKVYGPKGMGALYVRRKPRARLMSQIHGGGHEQGLRSGTLAPHQIVGMGESFSIAKQELDAESKRLLHYREKFLNKILEIDGINLNGHRKNRLPGNINISINGISSDVLLQKLSNLAISTGSACTSATIEPSYVLTAIGLSDLAADSSLRISFGRLTDEKDVDIAIESIAKIKHS